MRIRCTDRVLETHSYATAEDYTSIDENYGEHRTQASYQLIGNFRRLKIIVEYPRTITQSTPVHHHLSHNPNIPLVRIGLYLRNLVTQKIVRLVPIQTDLIVLSHMEKIALDAKSGYLEDFITIRLWRCKSLKILRPNLDPDIQSTSVILSQRRLEHMRKI